MTEPTTLTLGAPRSTPAVAAKGAPRRWPPLTARRVLFFLAVVVVLVISLFPFYWVLRTSLEPSSVVAQGTKASGLLPGHPTFNSYVKEFTQQHFLGPIVNSAVVALVTTVITVVVGSLAGYALARLPIRGGGVILGFILLTGFFPILAMVGPLFLFYRKIGFLDSIYPLTLTYLVYTLPLATWLLKSFFSQIPRELEEAALVDGATRLQVLRRVVIPVAIPGVFTAAILSFILAWNDFTFALSFLSSPSRYTAPLAIVSFSQTRFQVFYNRIDAAVVIVSIPIALMVLLLQRRIVSGLTAGALK